MIAPGCLQAWDIRDANVRAELVERTFLECIISEASNECIDVIVHDNGGDDLGRCRSGAPCSRGRTRVLWEQQADA